MTNAPLMPKATAVWLVENTALSFDQIADFCKLHPLEVKAVADGDAAQGIKGLDPLQTGQLTREEIAKGGYIAKQLVTPGERIVKMGEARESRKMDVRLYTYDGKLLIAAARLYQGQTTNFRTSGGGFAPVFIV